MRRKLSAAQQAMNDLLERHVKAELDGDLDTTMLPPCLTILISIMLRI